MVDCKICGHPYCEHAGTQRGIVIDCANYMPRQKPQTNAEVVREWIPVTERLPECETEVLILAKCGNRHIITTGMYEDGRKTTDDSNWWWQETDVFEYDEEKDAYLIPEGWWEYKHYTGDDEYNHAIDDIVTHWMPLPEPPMRKGENG